MAYPCAEAQIEELSNTPCSLALPEKVLMVVGPTEKGDSMTTTAGQISRQEIYSTISLLTKNYTMLTDTNNSVNFTALNLSGMHSATTSTHQKNQVDVPSRQHGHHPIPKRIKAYLRACINTYSSTAGGDHKGKRPKFVMPPRAQGLVSNTHQGKKHMLKTCTHDRMIGGKAAK